jgi:phosphate-selective porin OprO/OprP
MEFINVYQRRGPFRSAIVAASAGIAAIVLLVAMPAAAQEAPAEAAAPRDGRWSVRWDNHPEVEWSGGLRMEFRARLQGDSRASRAAVERGDGDRFDVGRRRVGVDGEIGPALDFQIEGEIERTNPWRDVYVNYRPMRGAQIQAGQFKIPFGLEETTSGGNLDFIYRSIVSTRLAPGRDGGVMLHGRVARRTVGYEMGIFAHDGDNARPKGGTRVFGGRTLAGRVTVEPFRHSKSMMSDLEVGVAFTRSSLPQGFPAVRGKSVLGVSFFDSDVWVEGSRRRDGVQVRWRPGPFSVASEYIRVSDDRRGQSQAGTDLPPLLARGWYVSGTWVVAGATGAADVDQPARPLFQGGYGSIQVAMRLERLSFGSIADTNSPSTSPRADVVLGNRETAMTFGATWHLNRWIKMEGNVIREQIGGTAVSPVPHLRVWSRLIRFQLAI